MAGIYIHIPFCKQACFYCDFHFSTNQTLKDEMVDAIAKELTLQREYVKDETIRTIYFGGGTPSVLNEIQVAKLISLIQTKYHVVKTPEITFEANPDDLTIDKLEMLRNVGVNRLSIGIQSFDNNVLKFLNRAHNAQEAINCIANARKIGFDNISIDLIYAIPNRSHEQWVTDLKNVIALKPEHISSYCLTIEPDTVFGHQHRKGKLEAVKDDLAADQFDLLIDHLSKAGYEQYEVSNFCKPNLESKHNSSYWKQQVYLGVGPSAHSYNKENRQFNVSNNKKYIDAINENVIPFTLDKLTKKDQINDYLLTTLRTKWGADLNRLKNEYHYDLFFEQKKYISTLIKQKKASIENNHLTLNSDGFLLADQISSDLFLI